MTQGTARTRNRPQSRLIAQMACAAGLALAATSAYGLERDAIVQPAGPSLSTSPLPVATLDGDIDLAASNAWSWTTPTGETVLYLERDVVLRLAQYAFKCERAVLWFAPSPDDPGATQVFAYLFEMGAPEADASVSLKADRLPLHGAVRDTDGPNLRVPTVLRGPPQGRDRAAAIREATGALTALLRASATTVAPTTPAPASPPPSPVAPDEPPPAESTPLAPIFETGGVLYISPGDRVTTRSGRDANTLILTGGVVIQYAGPTRSLEFSARRVVVFLRPGPLRETLTRIDESDVLGIYLEGGVVATDTKVTLRGPRIYYDLQADRALVLDAVFRTFDARLQSPLYLRAAAIRQEAANQFVADRATIATTGFSRPHLALGIDTVTIERRERPDGQGQTYVDARGIVPRLNNVPFFYLPTFQGDPERFPLKNIGFQDSNRQGPLYRTEWDPFVLLGINGPPGVNASLLVDYYEQRGFATGLLAEWDNGRQRGDLYSYLVFNDTGFDLLRNSVEIDRDGETRGGVLFRHQTELSELWTLTLEASHLSDEAFLIAFQPEIGRERYDITNRVHLQRQEDNRIIAAEVKAASNDFAPAEHQLQSPGYRVDKLPEIEARGIAEDLSSLFEPGLISYSWDAGFASVRQRFTEVTPRDFGITNTRGFGIGPDDPIGDAFRNQGLNEDIVNRFDTRHEIGLDLDAGPVQINPFVVGRLTAYDSDFTAFSPEETDNARLFGAAGVRLSTAFHRVDDSVESRTLDLHRMRHIVEPSVTLWHGESTVAAQDLPVFDDDVEPLAEGTAARLAIEQTWQSKRGGPGRWRDVDVFTLDFGWTFAGEDFDRGGPRPRWYDPRPELSSTQRALDVQGTWQVSEILAIGGEWVYDVEDSQADQASIGAVISHGRGLSLFGELRTLREQGDTYANAGARYPFGDKYDLLGNVAYNFDRDEIAAYSLTVLRSFPNGDLGVAITFDNIAEETSFGFVFQPTGFARSFAVQGVGSTQGDRQRSGF